MNVGRRIGAHLVRNHGDLSALPQRKGLEMKVRLHLTGHTDAGGSPLVMHNERLADPLDSFTRAIAAVSKKRNKTEADHMEIARLEFMGGLYTDPRIEADGDLTNAAPVLPAWNVLRALQDGATRHKRGKDVLRGVYPLTETVSVDYDGAADARTPADLWADGRYALRKTVGVQRSRTVRTRPVFTEWDAVLEVEVDPVIFDLDALANVWNDAGKYAGLGDMRPVYGRFQATVEEVK